MRERSCERCTTGTETCVIGNFYTCDNCESVSVYTISASLAVPPPDPSLSYGERMDYFADVVESTFSGSEPTEKTYREINSYLRKYQVALGPGVTFGKVGTTLEWTAPILVDLATASAPTEWADLLLGI